MNLRRSLPFIGHETQLRDALIAKAASEAETGRRLAMFDRQTGLCAHWYLQLRFEEEVRRAERYRRPLTLLLIEASNDEAFRTRDEVTELLKRELRSSDIASHLGDGRFVCLLTETGMTEATALAARLEASFKQAAAIGLASCPQDGATLEDLQKMAQHSAQSNWTPAL